VASSRRVIVADQSRFVVRASLGWACHTISQNRHDGISGDLVELVHGLGAPGQTSQMSAATVVTMTTVAPTGVGRVARPGTVEQS